MPPGIARPPYASPPLPCTDALQGKAEKKNKNKRKRQQSSSPSSSSSDSDAAGTSSGSSSSSDDDEGKTNGSVKRVKLASHVGRYSKRERAKFVKNYSASDLDAILGGPAKQAAAEEEAAEAADAGADPLGFMPALNLVEVRAAAREDDSSSSDEEDGGEGKPGAAAVAASAPAAAGGEGKKQRKAKAAEAAPPPEEEWEPGKKPWWAGMFVRAGRMGSIKQELKGGHSGKPKINVSGFKEQDQENLYEQVRGWWVRASVRFAC